MEARTDSPPPVQQMPSSSDDRSIQVNSRRRGRPRKEIPAVGTKHLTIEPRRELRKRGPAGVKVDNDPWVKLSKAPSITPLSPKKVPQSGPSRLKPVICFSCYVYDMF